MWYCTAIVVLVAFHCQAFNVDVYEPIVRASIQDDNFDDLANKDLFGFQVALYNSNSGVRMIVGAPKGSTTTPPPDAGNHNLSYGVVYNCPVNPGTCAGLDGFNGAEQLVYDSSGNGVDEQNDVNEQKNGQFMGGTVRVGDSGLLVCAPRYIRLSGDLATNPVTNPIGRCVYTYDRDLIQFFPDFANVGDNRFRLCEQPPLLPPGGDHLANSACSAGTGGDVFGNVDFVSGTGGVNSAGLSVGIPGLINWRGAFIEYNDLTGRGGVFGDLPSPENSALFGYKLVHYRSGRDQFAPDVVTSAPRYNQLRGLIAFFRNSVRAVSDPLQVIGGSKVGSTFGASLAAVDFTGDGLDEIVVGAPTYSDGDNVNVGQILIYANTSGMFTLFRTITGTEKYAQFGYAISGLGDINNNGLEDFAVGAPFGEGSGTVYIYSGVGGDEMIMLSQVIRGSELNLNLPMPQSFGSSLSNGIDADGNGYPDFAVGAYLSQYVYLLRSRPVADMSLSFNFSAPGLNLDTGPTCMFSSMPHFCIDASACFSYDGLNVSSTLNVNYEFVIERRTPENVHFSRAFFQSSGTSMISAANVAVTRGSGNGVCITETILFRNNAADEYTPLSIEFILSLPEPNPNVPPPTDGNTTLNTLLSGDVLRIVGSNTTQLIILNGCGTDGVCIPDLRIAANGAVRYEVDGEVVNTVTSVSAGVVTAVQIPLQFLNSGSDPAVSPTISFDLPPGVGFITAYEEIGGERGSAQICSETAANNNITQVRCRMGIVLLDGVQKNYVFRIQTRRIIGSEDAFSITFVANSSNPDDPGTIADNSYTVNFEVTAIADVFIQSSFRPDSVEIGNRQPDTIDDASQLGPMVQGQFVVRNSGPSLIPNVQLNISWPSDNGERFFIYPSVISVDSSDVVCSEEFIDTRNYTRRRKRQSVSNTGGSEINCRTGHDSCVAIICDISNLRANESSTIRIEGNVDDSSFSGRTESVRLIAHSSVTIGVSYITQPASHQPDNGSAILVAVPATLSGGDSDDSVEAWVIIVPIIVAIIVIVVAAILLYFFGFFKRKTVDRGDEIDLTGETPEEPGSRASPQAESATEAPSGGMQRFSNTDI